MKPPTDPPPALILHNLRKVKLNWSMEKMAALCGYRTASGYQSYENPHVHPGWLPMTFVRDRLAPALVKGGATLMSEQEVMLTFAGATRPRNDPYVNEHFSLQNEIDTSTIIPPGKLLGQQDLPVYASAEGGEGMLVLPDIVEYVKRPEPLWGVERAFAVYLIGDSMAPAYEQGDLVLVNASRPVGKGEFALLATALLVEGGEINAIVKRIVSWNDQVWRVRQYNPDMEFDLPRSEWRVAHPVVGKYNARR